jgi:elongation factor P--beta-lysine ligase
LAISIWKISEHGATRRPLDLADQRLRRGRRVAYIIDLVRPATSAALAASPSQLSLKTICTNIFEGYEHGIELPEAFVLDRQHMWLRKRFVVGEAERAMFWQRLKSNISKC